MQSELEEGITERRETSSKVLAQEHIEALRAQASLAPMSAQADALNAAAAFIESQQMVLSHTRMSIGDIEGRLCSLESRMNVALGWAFEDVQEFFEASERTPLKKPNMHNSEHLDLAIRLIHEEVNKETLPAMRRGDIVGSTDGIVDSIYVLIFAALLLGLPIVEAWQLVQKANMAKFPGGKAIKDANGKVMKPPGWQPPDIEGLIKSKLEAP